MSVTEARAAEYAEQQPRLMTGGRTDTSGCYVLLTEFWRSQDDMCPNTATRQVCVDDYRCGMTADGMFEPATTYTKVCGDHEEQVRRAPGFRWSRPL